MPKPVDPARRHLLGALETDLLGPYDPDTGDEVLTVPPLRWYLTGFLIPEGQSRANASLAGDEDEGMEAGDDAGPDEHTAEPDSKQHPILPSSLGLSVLLPASGSPRWIARSRAARLGLSWLPVQRRVLVRALEPIPRSRLAMGLDNAEQLAFFPAPAL